MVNTVKILLIMLNNVQQIKSKNRVIQKTAEATGDLNSNKVANKYAINMQTNSFERNYDTRETNNTISQIKFNIEMVKLSFCDWNDACILL